MTRRLVRADERAHRRGAVQTVGGTSPRWRGCEGREGAQTPGWGPPRGSWPVVGAMAAAPRWAHMAAGSQFFLWHEVQPKQGKQN